MWVINKYGRANHAWINTWKGGGEFLIRRLPHYIALSIEVSEFQSLDIFETLDETAPFYGRASSGPIVRSYLLRNTFDSAALFVNYSKSQVYMQHLCTFVWDFST